MFDLKGSSFFFDNGGFFTKNQLVLKAAKHLFLAKIQWWNRWRKPIMFDFIRNCLIPWVVPPPSNSGKWRFIGIPYYKCYVILVVTGILGGAASSNGKSMQVCMLFASTTANSLLCKQDCLFSELLYCSNGIPFTIFQEGITLEKSIMVTYIHLNLQLNSCIDYYWFLFRLLSIIFLSFSEISECFAGTFVTCYSCTFLKQKHLPVPGCCKHLISSPGNRFLPPWPLTPKIPQNLWVNRNLGQPGPELTRRNTKGRGQSCGGDVSSLAFHRGKSSPLDLWGARWVVKTGREKGILGGIWEVHRGC